MTLIEVDKVSKAFKIPSVRRETLREHVLGLLQPRHFDRLQVLDSVSFEVRRGETLGIMGRNGSGKSTLLKTLCGIYTPDRGRVTVRAPVTPILELGVGWNPELDAIDNVFLIGTVMGLTLDEVRRGMDEILAFAEIERFAHLELKHFSSGMSSRLAYAVAFQAVREVLVLDEIFAVGDAGFKARCEARYRELHAQGHTVVLVSHDPRTVATFCDRALLLEGGRLVMDDASSVVADRYIQTLTKTI
jgi:ABC-type polysaccharide/polyol phosphate transport system ATPase subunit